MRYSSFGSGIGIIDTVVSLNSLPQARVIKNKSKHNLDVASVMRNCVIKLGSYLSEFWKILPANSREIMMLNMIASIIKDKINGSIIRISVLCLAGIIYVGGFWRQ